MTSNSPPESSNSNCVPYTSSRISINHSNNKMRLVNEDVKQASFSKDKQQDLRDDNIKQGKDNEISSTPSPPPMKIMSTTTNLPLTPSTPPSKRSSLYLKNSSTQFLSPDKKQMISSPEKRSSQYLSPMYDANQHSSTLPNSPAGFISNKRTSLGYQKLTYPQTPERTSNNVYNELASPGRNFSSPKYSTNDILNSTDKLQEISTNLKTRLSYAFLKVQQDKSSENLENYANNNNNINSNNNLDYDEDNEDERPFKRRSVNLSSPSSKLKHKSLPIYQHGNFLNHLMTVETIKSELNSSSTTLMEPFNTPMKNPNSNNYNFEQEENITSANVAFQAALSRGSPKKSKNFSNTSLKKSTSLEFNQPKIEIDNNNTNDDDEDEGNDTDETVDDKTKEREAVQSLLSLSSPISKSKPTSAPSSTKKLKKWRQRSSFTGSPTPISSKITMSRILNNRNDSYGNSSSTEEEEFEEEDKSNQNIANSTIKYHHTSVSSSVTTNSTNSTTEDRSESGTPLQIKTQTTATV